MTENAKNLLHHLAEKAKSENKRVFDSSDYMGFPNYKSAIAELHNLGFINYTDNLVGSVELLLNQN